MTAGPAPALPLEEGADPARAEAQRAELERTTRAARVDGHHDVVKPMGETELFPDVPPETLRAGVPARAASPGGREAAAPAEGLGPQERVESVVAMQERGAELRGAVVSARQEMAAERSSHEGKLAEERQQAESDVDEIVRQNADAQTAERRKARTDVHAERVAWSWRATLARRHDSQGRSRGDHQGRHGRGGATRRRGEGSRHARRAGKPRCRDGPPRRREEGRRGAGEGRAGGRQGIHRLAGGQGHRAVRLGEEGHHDGLRGCAGRGPRRDRASEGARRGGDRLRARRHRERDQARGRRADRDRRQAARRLPRGARPVPQARSRSASPRRRPRSTRSPRGSRTACRRRSTCSGRRSTPRSACWRRACSSWSTAYRAAVEGALKFARDGVEAFAAFAVLIKDIAADPTQWIVNLARGSQGRRPQAPLEGVQEGHQAVVLREGRGGPRPRAHDLERPQEGRHLARADRRRWRGRRSRPRSRRR